MDHFVEKEIPQPNRPIFGRKKVVGRNANNTLNEGVAQSGLYLDNESNRHKGLNNSAMYNSTLYNNSTNICNSALYNNSTNICNSALYNNSTSICNSALYNNSTNICNSTLYNNSTSICNSTDPIPASEHSSIYIYNDPMLGDSIDVEPKSPCECDNIMVSIDPNSPELFTENNIEPKNSHINTNTCGPYKRPQRNKKSNIPNEEIGLNSTMLNEDKLKKINISNEDKLKKMNVSNEDQSSIMHVEDIRYEQNSVKSYKENQPDVVDDEGIPNKNKFRTLNDALNQGNIVLNINKQLIYKNSPYEKGLIFRNTIEMERDSRHPLDHPLLLYFCKSKKSKSSLIGRLEATRKSDDPSNGHPVFACPLCHSYWFIPNDYSDVYIHYESTHWIPRKLIRTKFGDTFTVFPCYRYHSKVCRSQLLKEWLPPIDDPKIIDKFDEIFAEESIRDRYALSYIKRMGKKSQNNELREWTDYTSIEIEAMHNYALNAPVDFGNAALGDKANIIFTVLDFEESIIGQLTELYCSKLRSKNQRSTSTESNESLLDHLPISWIYGVVPHWHCPYQPNYPAIPGLQAYFVENDALDVGPIRVEGSMHIPYGTTSKGKCEGGECPFVTSKFSELLAHLEGVEEVVNEEVEKVIPHVELVKGDAGETGVGKVQFADYSIVFDIDLEKSKHEKYGSMIEQQKYNWNCLEENTVYKIIHPSGESTYIESNQISEDMYNNAKNKGREYGILVDVNLIRKGDDDPDLW